jgi:tRNA(Ile)-lysidine synthase
MALAVSGGSDSLAMLHLALAERPVSSLVALTVDHGLRPESREEARQVSAWCAALGVEHHILTWDGEKPGTGIQAKARLARYDLMTQWCARHGVGVLLTAHTLDDQAETVVMRKARTNSSKSLAGIWPETVWNGIRIVRPVLGIRREALRAFLRARGFSWIDDPGNDNPAYERVRVRQALSETDIVGLAAQSDAARARVVRLQADARDALSSLAKVSRYGTVSFAREAVRGLRREIAAEVLSRVVKAAGAGRTVDPDPLLALVDRTHSKDCFRATLGGALIAVRKADMQVGREFGRIPPGGVKVSGTSPVLWDGRFVVSAPAGSAVAAAGNSVPRPTKAVPANVLFALPAVTLPDGHVILPHFDAQIGVTVTLGERFRW